MRLAAVLVAALVVVDGDSIVLDGERIRIMGLDAPEGRNLADIQKILGDVERPYYEHAEAA